MADILSGNSTIGTANPFFITMPTSNVSRFAVIQRHQLSINNAKNLSVSESRRHSLLMQKDYEEAERAHRQEIERLREDFERSMREKEERHRCKIREFQDRDNAWQQEKQVSHHTG